MSMWKDLRKNYTKYTLEDIGKKVGKTKQYISRYENGEIKMPYDLQIMYLSFRNSDADKIIIEHFKKLGGDTNGME